MKLLNSTLLPRNALFACLTVVMCVRATSETLSDTPQAKPWKVIGRVFALAQTYDTLYLGGEFRGAGRPAGGFTSVDAETGVANTSTPNINGYVNAWSDDGAGGWYLGGDFKDVGGTPRQNLVHLFADGSVDPSWLPTTDDNVTALAVTSDTVFIGGQFTRVNGIYKVGGAALDRATGELADFFFGTGGSVYSFEIVNETLYLGGYFGFFRGVRFDKLAAFDLASREFTHWNPSIPDDGFTHVDKVVVSNNTAYVFGWFDNINGETRHFAAGVDTLSGALTDWAPNVDARVFDAIVVGNQMFIAGEFTTVGGAPHQGLALVDTQTGLAATWDAGVDGAVYSLLKVDESLYMGGGFSSVGGLPRSGVARLDIASADVMEWKPDPIVGPAWPVAKRCESIWIGGRSSYFGQGRKNLMAINKVTGEYTPWNPDADGPVRALAVSGDVVYAGGEFTHVGGEARQHAVALDRNSGLPSAWNPGVDGPVHCIAISGDVAYLGGAFEQAGGEPRRNLASISTETGSATSWAPDPNGIVHCILVAGERVYIGGEFTEVGGTRRHYAAALDAATGELLDWVPEANTSVYALARYAGTIYLGGKFTSIGGRRRDYLAAVDANSARVQDWNPGADNRILTISVVGDYVYAGGAYLGATEQPLRRLDRRSGENTGWTPLEREWVYAIAPTDEGLYVGDEYFGRPQIVPENDTCGDVLPVLTPGLVYTGSTTGATGAITCTCGGLGEVDLWFVFNAPASGTAFFYTCATNFPTRLSVSTACGGEPIACSGDFSVCAADAALAVNMSAGSSYYIRLSGDDGATGNYSLFTDFSSSDNEGATTGTLHSADTNGDWDIDLAELLRVIQFYNLGIHCAQNPGDTEDGFVPGTGDLLGCGPHDADFDPQDWRIGMNELLRVIQLHNLGGYQNCATETHDDGYCPKF